LVTLNPITTEDKEKYKIKFNTEFSEILGSIAIKEEGPFSNTLENSGTIVTCFITCTSDKYSKA
jgi:hypothetical protein